MELDAIPHSMVRTLLHKYMSTHYHTMQEQGSLEFTVGSAQLLIGSGTEQVMHGFVELQYNQIVQVCCCCTKIRYKFF